MATPEQSAFHQQAQQGGPSAFAKASDDAIPIKAQRWTSMAGRVQFSRRTKSAIVCAIILAGIVLVTLSILIPTVIIQDDYQAIQDKMHDSILKDGPQVSYCVDIIPDYVVTSWHTPPAQTQRINGFPVETLTFVDSADQVATLDFEKAGPNYAASLEFDDPLLTFSALHDLVEMETLSGLLLADLDVLQLHWDSHDLHQDVGVVLQHLAGDASVQDRTQHNLLRVSLQALLPSSLPTTVAATTAADTLAQCDLSHAVLTSSEADVSPPQYGLGYGLEPGTAEYDAVYEGVLEEAKKQLGVAITGTATCREGGFPRFEAVELPVVVHVVQYVDSRDTVVAPPLAGVSAVESVQRLIAQTNTVLKEAGTKLGLSLLDVRADPREDEYLLQDSFHSWQGCYQNATCLSELAREAQGSWLATGDEASGACDDASAIHVLVVGSQSACLKSVNRPADGVTRCPAGLINTVPGPDVEQLPGSFIQATWEVVDTVFHNSARVGESGARHLAHLLGHYLGVLNTEAGEKCADQDLPQVAADTPAESGPIVSNPKFDQRALMVMCYDPKQADHELLHVEAYNSCAARGLDNVFNIMASTHSRCRTHLTPCQTAQMQATLTVYRPQLLAAARAKSSEGQ